MSFEANTIVVHLPYIDYRISLINVTIMIARTIFKYKIGEIVLASILGTNEILYIFDTYKVTTD